MKIIVALLALLAVSALAYADAASDGRALIERRKADRAARRAAERAKPKPEVRLRDAVRRYRAGSNEVLSFCFESTQDEMHRVWATVDGVPRNLGTIQPGGIECASIDVMSGAPGLVSLDSCRPNHDVGCDNR